MERRVLVFWTPTISFRKDTPPYQPLQLSDAELVIAGQASGSVGALGLDLRRFEHCRVRRYASVEIEVSRYARHSSKQLNRTLQMWSCSVVRDGTVPDGFEINAAPACGDALYDQITDICAGLHSCRAVTGVDAGLHVHVDARDFGYQEIQRLVRIYSVIEESLFASVHPSRYSSIFCQHCADSYYEQMVLGVKAGELKSKIIEGTYGAGSSKMPVRGGRPERARDGYMPRFVQVRQDHYGGGRGMPRYNSLNIHSWFFRGTVESRIHHGTTDASTIFRWAKLWLEIMDYVNSATEAQVCSLVDGATGNRDIRGLLDMPRRGTSDTWLRVDLGKEDVCKGVHLLSTILSSKSFEYLCDRIKYFARNPNVAVGMIVPAE